MASVQTNNAHDLIRTDVWSDMVKELLRDELMAASFVKTVNSFQDGDRLHIPSIGDLTASSYQEGTPIKFSPVSTGDWTLEINSYKQSGVSITDKFLQDSYVAATLLSGLPMKISRAIMEEYEKDVFTKPETVFNTGTNSQAVINGAPHRFAGSGAGGTLDIANDFAWAKNALMNAKVPVNNLVAIVPPNVATRIERTLGAAGLNVNPMWDRVFREGTITDSRFVTNLFGWDVYTSHRLPEGLKTDTALPTYDGSATVDFTATGSKGASVCLFFSNNPLVTPWLGTWREAPNLYKEYNVKYRQTELSTTARWGVGLYRPEAVVEILVEPTV